MSFVSSRAYQPFIKYCFKMFIYLYKVVYFEYSHQLSNKQSFAPIAINLYLNVFKQKHASENKRNTGDVEH